MVSMNYGSSRSNWKPWRRLRFDLILSIRDMHINSNQNPLTKLTSSSRSIEPKDILQWNISQIIMKTIPISMGIAISYAMKWGILLWIWAGLLKSPSGIQVGKLTIWVRSKIITKYTRSISSTGIHNPVLMMDVKVSKNNNVCRCVDRENVIYVRWNRIKNWTQRPRRW